MNRALLVLGLLLPCHTISVSDGTAMADVSELKEKLHLAVSSNSELEEKLLEKDEDRPVITQNITDEDWRGDIDHICFYSR